MRFLRTLLRLGIGLLRELSDENAYQRYLIVHHVAHSGEQWRKFSDQRLRARYLRAKCC
ncbi:MAG TPA: hypothetical protein VJN43_13410 [Bryobacteraceae bacterium]|nr:hypothetical protein [Bryobacteraceae bacterium]